MPRPTGDEGELVAALRARYAEHLPPKPSPDQAPPGEVAAAEAHYELGMRALAAGNPLEAAAHLTEAAALHPDARIWFHCGVAAARALDVQSAAACFERLDACDAAQLEELYRAVPREKVSEVRAQATMLAGKVRHGQWRERAAQLLLVVLVVILVIAGWMFFRE